MESKNQSKTEPQELLATIKALNEVPNCKNCNTVPHVLVELPVDTIAKLDEQAQTSKLKSSACVLCQTIQAFCKLPEDKQMLWLSMAVKA